MKRPSFKHLQEREIELKGAAGDKGFVAAMKGGAGGGEGGGGGVASAAQAAPMPARTPKVAPKPKSRRRASGFSELSLGE